MYINKNDVIVDVMSGSSLVLDILGVIGVLFIFGCVIICGYLSNKILNNLVTKK